MYALRPRSVPCMCTVSLSFGYLSFGYIDVLVKQVNPHKLPNCALGNSTNPLQGLESGPCNAHSKKVARQYLPTTALCRTLTCAVTIIIIIITCAVTNSRWARQGRRVRLWTDSRHCIPKKVAQLPLVLLCHLSQPPATARRWRLHSEMTSSRCCLPLRP